MVMGKNTIFLIFIVMLLVTALSISVYLIFSAMLKNEDIDVACDGVAIIHFANGKNVTVSLSSDVGRKLLYHGAKVLQRLWARTRCLIPSDELQKVKRCSNYIEYVFVKPCRLTLYISMYGKSEVVDAEKVLILFSSNCSASSCLPQGAVVVKQWMLRPPWDKVFGVDVADTRYSHFQELLSMVNRFKD